MRQQSLVIWALLLCVALLAIAILAVPLNAFAGPLSDRAGPPAIRAELVQSYCVGTRPWVVVNLHVNSSDQGMPGIVYVATSDPSEQAANYTIYGDANWYPYQGEALYVPYIVAGGLRDAALPIPAGQSGWTLWVGYGTLTARTTAAVDAQAGVLAKAAQAGRQVPSVDPDHIRRSGIQEDMRLNNKYIAVARWGTNNIAQCDPNSSGG